MGLKYHSPLARQVKARRRRWRKMKVWGVCLHTTGRSIVRKAARHHKNSGDMAVEHYRKNADPHYVIDYSGNITQIQADNLRGAHVGISALERLRYLRGKWRKHFKRSAVARWQKRWPGKKSPQHLYPTHSPNKCYIGIEMPPLLVPVNGSWYTDEQLEAARLLCNDIGERHGLPPNWKHTSRLVGHEDIDAYARWDKSGQGWDPGALRDRPRLDWSKVILRPRPSDMPPVP